MSEQKFTAKQASELANQKKQPIDQILKTIENQAECGNRYIMVAYLHDETLLELVELGYAVSKFTDPFGVENTKIKW